MTTAAVYNTKNINHERCKENVRESDSVQYVCCIVHLGVSKRGASIWIFSNNPEAANEFPRNRLRMVDPLEISKSAFTKYVLFLPSDSKPSKYFTILAYLISHTPSEYDRGNIRRKKPSRWVYYTVFRGNSSNNRRVRIFLWFYFFFQTHCLYDRFGCVRIKTNRPCL